MTRKDYILIAAALKAAHNSPATVDGHRCIYLAAERIADALASDNPRFDIARFLKACGVQI